MKTYRLNDFDLGRITAFESSLDSVYLPAVAAQLHALLQQAAVLMQLTEADCQELLRLLPQTQQSHDHNVEQRDTVDLSVPTVKAEDWDVEKSSVYKQRCQVLAQQNEFQHFLLTIMREMHSHPDEEKFIGRERSIHYVPER